MEESNKMTEETKETEKNAKPTKKNGTREILIFGLLFLGFFIIFIKGYGKKACY